VYFEDIEAALAQQPGIDAAVVVAIDGPQGPEPAAVLRNTDAALATLAIEHANVTLSAHQRIGRRWIWPDLDLPRTATGKVRRHLVEAWARQQTERDTTSRDQSHQPDSLLRVLEQITGQVIRATAPPNGTPADATTLEALGLDSLGRVQLQAALERATGRTIDDASILGARTLGDLRTLAGLEPLQPTPSSIFQAAPAQNPLPQDAPAQAIAIETE
jgi:long-chain acyl-CoA synthetase